MAQPSSSYEDEFRVAASRSDIRLLHCGVEFFPALLQAVECATSCILLETYIFATDDAALAVLDALGRAAARGVEVRVVADWLGTGRTRCRQLAKVFRDRGIEFRCFNPWFTRGVARTHRKICVIDRRMAFVGGININHDMHSADGPETLPYPRWDFAVRLVGQIVAAVQSEAETQWLRSGHLPVWDRLRLLGAQRVRSRQGVALSPDVSFVTCDNFHNRFAIQAAYLAAINQSRNRVLIANPYFAPSRTFRDALATAAGRGVEVVLLLGVGQYPFQDAVARSYYAKLLRAGVQLYEYRRTLLHGKVAIVDDHWTTVGSSNCDGLSLFVNHEANVVVSDPGFSTMLAARVRAAVNEASRVDPTEYLDIRWYRRLGYGAAFLAYRAVLRLITLKAFD